MLKSNKGITLVALVITIIVLLILAGVTMMLALGNNGILGQASSARVTQIEAEVKEQMQLALVSAKTEMMAKIASDPSKEFTQQEVAGFVTSALPTGTVITGTGANDITKGYNVTPTASTKIDTTTVTFTITYNGQDYRSATDKDDAVITRTFEVTTYNLKDNNDTWSNYVKDTKALGGTAANNKI